MLCESCGHQNKKGALFCTECGSRLKAPTPKGVSCRQCGHKNPAGVNYCSNCGESLVGKHPRAKSNHKRKSSVGRRNRTPAMSSNAKLITVLGAVVVVAILLVKAFSPEPKAVRLPAVTTSTLNPLLDAQFLRVVQQFNCACGSCGGTPLEECSCPTAEKERAFIAEQLNKGNSVEQTVALVDAAFGWRKESP